MRKYIVILILFITVSIKAQDIHTVITGAASNTSGAITTTTDGGYVAVGSMKLLRKDCPYIVKLSSTGAIQWAKAITNSSFNTDDLSGILQTSDGGFLLSGSQLIKIDSFGNVEWYKFEYSGKAIQTSDGGYAICGSVHGNSGTVTQFIKLDGTGNYEWHVSYIDTTGKETGATITTAIEAQDGYYVFGEASRVSNTPRQMLTHISKAGTIIWHRGYSLNGTKTAFAAGLTRTTDNGFVMGCYTFPLSFSGTDDEADQLCIKLDSLGNVLWTIEIDGFSP
ncbi:MAG TPA: hypothetical protein VFO76_03545, partial [Candidatus Kapabacteria bacterium]|nr:hypothetical protein [Candidatus Kapabacteria bacterium]